MGCGEVLQVAGCVFARPDEIIPDTVESDAYRYVEVEVPELVGALHPLGQSACFDLDSTSAWIDYVHRFCSRRREDATVDSESEGLPNFALQAVGCSSDPSTSQLAQNVSMQVHKLCIG